MFTFIEERRELGGGLEWKRVRNKVWALLVLLGEVCQVGEQDLGSRRCEVQHP